MKVLIYRLGPKENLETFIRASIEKSPFETVFVTGNFFFEVEGWDMRIENKLKSFAIRIISKIGQKSVKKFRVFIFKNLVKRIKPNLILAQFGTSGAEILDICREINIPLVVYFRGYDATKGPVINNIKGAYKELFLLTRANICVSKSIRNSIIQLGANPNYSFVNPSGADVSFFNEFVVSYRSKRIVAVGRFVEKKAPHLLILAFKEVLNSIPDAKLIFIGDGILFNSAKDLAESLKISNSIQFKGRLPHNEILSEMMNSSLFAQHSITAQDGDSEGTPVAIMEAAAIGLPIVATSHAGIPDVVVHGITGFLVPEKEVTLMANYITKLLLDNKLAREMGLAGKERIRSYFLHEVCLTRLDRILHWAAFNNIEKPELIPNWPQV